MINTLSARWPEIDDTTSRARKKRRRGYPAHLAQQAALAPRNGQGIVVGPSFRCGVCSEFYKLTALKHHKPSAFEHEQDVCRWCHQTLTGGKRTDV